MIIKNGQSVGGLELFVRKTRCVKAKQMNEEFMVETETGWIKGRKGDWLVLVETELWNVIGDRSFRRIFTPYVEDIDCLQHCDHPFEQDTANE